MSRENYEVTGVSEMVSDYHLSMLNVEDKEELERIRADTKKRMENSTRTATAHYFINAFLPYLEPEYMEAMILDRICLFNNTFEREPEQNIGRVLLDSTYSTLFQVLIPAFVPFYNDMMYYLVDLQED